MSKPQTHTSATATAVEGLDQVHAAVKALIKYISGRKLYADNNPRLAQFRGELHGALSRFFEDETDLVLSVDQHTISWCGNEVYRNPKRDESVAFALYKDGVGEVTIDAKSLGGEIDAFVKILTDDLHNADPEEDVVTRLWNADFDHISYRVMDDYLTGETDPTAESDDESGNEIADQAELLPSLKDKGRIIVKQSDPLESIDEYLHRLIMEDCESTDSEEREAYFQSMVASFFEADESELAACHRERERELAGDSLGTFAETVFVFTLLQDNPSAVRDVSAILERVFEYVVKDRDPRTLTRMLVLVRGFRESHTLPEAIASLCDRLEGMVTDPAIVHSMQERLRRWTSDSEECVRYFAVIGRPAVDSLLNVLHAVDNARLHRAICDLVVEVAADELPAIIERLDIDNPRVARDAVYLLGRIDSPGVTPQLQELLCYPDRGVKEETIDLIARMDDPAALELLAGALHDEDKATRCRALLAAAERGLPAAADYASSMAFSREVLNLDPAEQDAIFKALGLTGDAVTVEQLRKIARKKHILDLSGGRENKILAIRALEYILEPTSMELLERFAQDSNDTVKARARRALAALNGRMTRAAGGGDTT